MRGRPRGMTEEGMRVAPGSRPGLPTPENVNPVLDTGPAAKAGVYVMAIKETHAV